MNEIKYRDALEVLRTYDWGSNRSALAPIDEAAGAHDAAGWKALEQHLLNVLRSGVAAPAREYICRKLELIGSPAAVPALGPLLSDPDVQDAARGALEKIPGPAVVREFETRLKQVGPRERLGIIQSLGRHGDSSAVRVLRDLGRGSDASELQAVSAALGTIGTAAAGDALLGMHRRAGPGAQGRLADGMLECAARLERGGEGKLAKKIYAALSNDRAPAHVREAARAGSNRA